MLRWRRAQALLGLGRIDAAERDLRDATDGARRQSLIPVLWQALATLGEHRRAQGRHDEADAAFAEALQAAEGIAHSLLTDDPGLRQTFLASPGVSAVRDALGSRASL